MIGIQPSQHLQRHTQGCDNVRQEEENQIGAFLISRCQYGMMGSWWLSGVVGNAVGKTNDVINCRQLPADALVSWYIIEAHSGTYQLSSITSWYIQ
jgi:hypothetical protein